MKLFCKTRTNDTDPFNPQVLFTTSGAANYGIDKKNIYTVFQAERPPSCEDMAQEKGRVGCQIEANLSTDSYTICNSLEYLINLLRRIYVGPVDNNSYQKSPCFDVDVMLAYIYWCLITE